MNKKRILLCDDDEGILEVATLVLQECGYEVTGLIDSSQIYKTIEKVNPQIILLDLWMPNLSGDVIAKTLKKNDATKHIPIIIVSASKDTEKIATDAGANDFIAKPFDIFYLEEIVKKNIL